ncbi:MAG: helix-turn-helix transcriptional regulator [Lachnospiraceae bacterium]|nr:helix-turn-helix transcriptional regulator [Lachnospiraceae bacterium]
MTISERIKELCRLRGITVAKLERDCDFSNGYVGKIRSITTEKADKIASYLNVPVRYLISGESEAADEEKDPEADRLIRSFYDNPALRELFTLAMDAGPEDIETVARILRRYQAGISRKEGAASENPENPDNKAQ